MGIFDLFRQEYVRGQVVDKYQLENGNLGLIVEDLYASKRYHVEFKDNYEGPNAENLYGLLKKPFAEKTESLNKAVQVGDTIDVTLSYSKSPFREAYRLHRIHGKRAYRPPVYKFRVPYRLGNASQY